MDFNRNNNELRGYGCNTKINNKQINRFRKFYFYTKVFMLPIKVVSKFFNSLKYYYIKIISYLILKNSSAHIKFGISGYNLTNYDSSLLQKFNKTLAKENIFFSHNSLKSFFYFQKIKEYLKINSNSKIEKLKAIEIGAGLFNFGYIISKNVKELNYVVIDLAEMINSAVYEIMDFYEPDFEIFLPNEIDEYYNSNSKRKVLFITPDLINKIKPGFDLFINHESFAEMNIDVVNDYLKNIKKLLRKKAYVFLVNRYCRIQATKKHDLENLNLESITTFLDYKLDFSYPIIFEIDSFRQKIPGQNNNPNILYIGQVK